MTFTSRIVTALVLVWLPLTSSVSAAPPQAREGILLPRSTQDFVASPDALTIHAGVRIALRLTATVSSDPKKEDRALLVTVYDFTVDDVVIIPKGTPVAFTVHKIAADRGASPGRLHLGVDGIYTATGRIVVPLRGELTREGDRCVESACAVAALLPWLKGANVSLPRGTLITATVDRNTSLDKGLVRQLITLLPPPESGDKRTAERSRDGSKGAEDGNQKHHHRGRFSGPRWLDYLVAVGDDLSNQCVPG